MRGHHARRFTIVSDLSPCPKCGTESNRTTDDFTRTIPGPPVRVRRYSCLTRGCGERMEFGDKNHFRRTKWDVETPL